MFTSVAATFDAAAQGTEFSINDAEFAKEMEALLSDESDNATVPASDDEEAEAAMAYFESLDAENPKLCLPATPLLASETAATATPALSDVDLDAIFAPLLELEASTPFDAAVPTNVTLPAVEIAPVMATPTSAPQPFQYPAFLTPQPPSPMYAPAPSSFAMPMPAPAYSPAMYMQLLQQRAYLQAQMQTMQVYMAALSQQIQPTGRTPRIRAKRSTPYERKPARAPKVTRPSGFVPSVLLSGPRVAV